MSKNNFELKDNYQRTSTSDLYYDFFEGGYLNPQNFLKNQDDIDQVNYAKTILDKYFKTLNDVVEYE